MILNLVQPNAERVRLPSDITDELVALRKLSSKGEALRYAYDLLCAKYQGFPIGTPLKLNVLFSMDIASLWRRNGPQYCTNMNYLLEILLVKSGWFTKEDIRLHWTILRLFSPHQYVSVQVRPNNWVAIDIWGSAHGISFGDHAHGFHIRSEAVSSVI